jgi:hypothetical protein
VKGLRKVGKEGPEEATSQGIHTVALTFDYE